MKKFYYLLLATIMSLGMYASTLDLDPAVVLADTMYEAADYTVPSYTEFIIAKIAARNTPTQENLRNLVKKVTGLQPKQMPYNMVVTINGDPHTQMGFAWFTNESIFDGELQIIAKADAAASDFEGEDVITVPAAAQRTKKALRYVGQCSYIYKKAELKAGTKYFYVSHKALATNLTPGTIYSWRVGHAGYWSDIAQFRTEEEQQGEYSFLLMSDSHIMDKQYVDEARRCAL